MVAILFSPTVLAETKMTTVRKKQITQELKESEQKDEAPITTTVPDSTSNDDKADDKVDR